MSGDCRPVIYFFLLVSNNIMKSTPCLHSAGGEQGLCVTRTFSCSSKIFLACTEAEFDPLSCSYNKVNAGATEQHCLLHYARSSYTRGKDVQQTATSAEQRFQDELVCHRKNVLFCSRNSSISQSPRELVSKNKSHRHVYKLTGNKHSNFGYRNWSKFCLTVYLNHLQSGLL